MSPVAPGTAGSLAACVVLFALRVGVHPEGATWQAIVLAMLVLACGLAVALGPWGISYFGRKDPGGFVLDEVAGVALTMLFQPMIGWRGVWTFVLVFVAFRIFDVIKPWPCKRLEKLPAGWGILADDLAAAVYANIVCRLVLIFVFGAT